MKNIVFTIAFLLFLVSSVSARAGLVFCKNPIADGCITSKLLPSGDYKANVPGKGWTIFNEPQANTHEYFLVVDVQPAYNPATQKLTGPTITFADNRHTRTWAAVALTADELATTVEQENLNDELISLVAAMSYADIETHINTVFGGLTTAQKASLIKLYRVVLYLAKQQ